MDELKFRRMKKCAESVEGHQFYDHDGNDECVNCGLTIERI